MSRILVTGASGFIGISLAASLSENHDVVCMNRKKPKLNLSYVHGEFSSFEDLRQLGKSRIDVVVHLAAVTGGCLERDGMLVNVEGMRCLMRYLMDRGCRKFVMASSIAAVGFQSTRFRPLALPIPDEHPCLDRDGYGFSKFMMEEVTKYYHRQNSQIDVINLGLHEIRSPVLRKIYQAIQVKGEKNRNPHPCFSAKKAKRILSESRTVIIGGISMPTGISKRERVEAAIRLQETDRIPFYDIILNDAIIEYFTGKIAPVGEEGLNLKCETIRNMLDMTRMVDYGPFDRREMKSSDGFVQLQERWTLGGIIKRPFHDEKGAIRWLEEKNRELAESNKRLDLWNAREIMMTHATADRRLSPCALTYGDIAFKGRSPVFFIRMDISWISFRTS